MSEEWEHDQEEEENEGIPEEEFNQNLADAFGFHYDPVNIKKERNTLDEFLLEKQDRIVPVVKPEYIVPNHKWIMEKQFLEYEDLGYMEADAYYKTQIKYWNTMYKEFCDNYKIEEEYAREVYNSQRLN